MTLKRCWPAVLRRARSQPVAHWPQDEMRALLALTRDDAYRGLAGVESHRIENVASAYVAAYTRLAAAGLRRAFTAADARGLSDASKQGNALLLDLAERLQTRAQKTVALLLNVARIRGELTGASSEERRKSHAELLMDAEYRLACRQRFPVLDDTLHAMTKNAVASWTEFFERLVEDASELSAVLPGGVDAIESAAFYAGDPHNGGRSVVIVKCANGTVVYKPRPLDTDTAFARAVDWLEIHLGLGLHHFRVMSRADHGWTEFVERRDCANVEEVDLCFERCGALVGLLFLLGGSDLHHENIICSGAMPYIIDVEALFNGAPEAPGKGLRRKQLARMETVLNVCYLPCLMQVGESFIDVTGAGYSEGQQLEFKSIVQASDDQDLNARPMTVATPESANLPSLAGIPQPAGEHLPAFERGFRAALEAMIAHRSDFLTRSGLMPSFAAVTSRYIPRATAQYGEITRNALHPHACVDRRRHDEALSVLAMRSGWSGPAAREIMAADVVAIRQGDIPFFKSAAGSRSIWTSSGIEIPRVFQESGHVSARRRIERLDEREIELQIKTIRLSFSASRAVPGGGGSRANVRNPRIDGNEWRLETAAAIGDLLLGQAIHARGHVYWIARTMFGKRYSAVMVEEDLYGGVAGIGVFFAELARLTGRQRFRRAALACRRTVLASASIRTNGVGGFSGTPGYIFADLAISHALKLAPAKVLPDLIRHVGERVAGDRTFDIIGGAAGALLVLLSARRRPELQQAADEAAHRCARHLIDHAERTDAGLIWRMPAFPVPLAGLAHGACGIGMALGEYAAAFDDEEAWTHAYAAFEYARSSFDEKAGLWRDLRHDTGYMVAWCHGAAGIALARQRVVELAPERADAATLNDITLGLRVLADQPGPPSDTICHGRSGNWEVLWRGDAHHRQLAELEAASLCRDFADGILPAGDLGEPTPDLMNGLAGVGLQLLRSLDRGVACVSTLTIPDLALPRESMRPA